MAVNINDIDAKNHWPISILILRFWTMLTMYFWPLAVFA